MFMRLIIFLLIGFLVWYFIRRFKRNLANLQRAAEQAAQGKSGAAKQIKMQRCLHCGLHIPDNEAVFSGSDAYCCEEHRLAGKS